MTKPTTIKERMVRLETLMTQALDEIKEMRFDLKASNNLFVTSQKHADDIKEVRDELLEIKSKRWVQNTLSAVLGAVLAVLISYFLMNILR